MNFAVLTIFPRMFAPFWEHGIVRRAIERGRITAQAIDIREFAAGRHRVTDDRPYGGGCGMVMKPEPLAAAIRATRGQGPYSHTVLLSPQGRVFDQETAATLAGAQGLIFVCGRYEGIDERVCRREIDLEISIGDFVLTGGELAAMVVMDAVTRLIPGTLGGEESAARDSFAQGLLEHAHYTRPPVFEGEAVPEVLRGGDHQAIAQWRHESALIRTLLKRRDLLDGYPLAREDLEIIRKWVREIESVIEA